MIFKDWINNQTVKSLQEIREDLPELTKKSWNVIRYYKTGLTICPPYLQEIITKYAHERGSLDINDVLTFPNVEELKSLEED